MTSLPLVSVYIPCYNQAEYLSRAIESALAQDYPNIEIIIGDDASTDQTPVIVESYKNDPKVRYCRSEKNIGRVANYRRGLVDLAQGEWFINLDGDDYYINPHYISKAIERTQRRPQCVLVFARQKYQDPNLGIVYTNPAPELPDFFPGLNLLTSPLKEGIPHLSTLYKREVALKAGLFKNDILYADAEAMIRMMPLGDFSFINEFAGVWVQHGKNASYSPGVEKRIANLQMTLSPYEFFKREKLVDPTQLEQWKLRMLKYQLHDTSLFFLDHGDKESFLKFYSYFKDLLPLSSRLSLFMSWRIWLRLFVPNAASWIRRIKGLLKK